MKHIPLRPVAAREVEAWLCRGESGSLTLWPGDRSQLHMLKSGSWGIYGNWHNRSSPQCYSPTAFCALYQIDPADLPAPGTCEQVKIEVRE